jgi:hypothetical protein
MFIFQYEEDFKIFTNILYQNLKESSVRCLHYVLMNTHIHLVIKLPDFIEHISEVFKMIFWKYSYHYKFRRRGQVFTFNINR